MLREGATQDVRLPWPDTRVWEVGYTLPKVAEAIHVIVSTCGRNA